MQAPLAQVSWYRDSFFDEGKMNFGYLYEAPFYLRGSATYYTYQADRSVFAEFARSDGGTATLSYVSKPGNIGYDVPDALQSDGRLHVYFLQNHLGSPVVSFTTQIDAVRLQPKISQIRDYDAYGKEIFNVVYLHTAKPGFTGKELDAEGVSTEGLVGDVGVRGLGLNYFGARYYDPEVAIWNSCDPASENWSSYVAFNNNPVIFVDPDGTENTVYIRNIGSTPLPKNYGALLETQLHQSGARAMQVKEVGAFTALFRTRDETDVYVIMTNNANAGYNDTRNTKAYGACFQNSQRAEVYSDNTWKENGLLQTMKTTVHEIGHALFGFDDNSGGVMNQGRVEGSSELNFTNEQKSRIFQKTSDVDGVAK